MQAMVIGKALPQYMVAVFETLHSGCNTGLWMVCKIMKTQPYKIAQNQLTSNLAGVKGSSFFDACLSFPDW